MRRPSPPARPAWPGRGLLGGLLVVLSAGGCHDSPADPLSGPTTVETVPSLALATPLPEPSELVDGTAPPPEIRSAIQDWERSWDVPGGAPGRANARRTVAGHLASALDARGVEEALRSLLWAETEVDDIARLPAELLQPLEEARSLTEEAARARRDGRLRDALEAGLAAADLYRSVTPEAVGRRMVARGRVLLAKVEAPPADTARESGHRADVTERARHLLNGAARALEEGDHRMAIQRAFYGIQVLEGRMDAADAYADGPPRGASGGSDPSG